MIDLCLRELFVFPKMQTDPNWFNFVWNVKMRQLGEFYFFSFPSQTTLMHVLDRIGGLLSDAELQGHTPFRDLWLRLLLAAAQQVREGWLHRSSELGYLAGKRMMWVALSAISFPSAMFG